MTQSKNDKLRSEVDLLRFRLKTARDKEILLLTQIIDMQKYIPRINTMVPTFKELEELLLRAATRLNNYHYAEKDDLAAEIQKTLEKCRPCD